MRAEVQAARGRWPLVALCGFVAITAIGGGVVLVASPDGSLMRAPLALLENSTFTSFLFPGLLLLVVVGGGSAIAGVLAARRHPLGNVAAFTAGIALLVWTVVEMILLRTANALQLVYLVVAFAIIFLSLARQLRARPLWAAPRQRAAA